jgi:hypothetical protein
MRINTMSANEIKQGMLVMGVVDSPEDLDWLTDEHIAEREKVAKEYPSVTDGDGKILGTVDYGNHFYTTDNGKVWHWESGKNITGGNLNCGRVDAWKYNVRRGDSYVKQGKCSGGYEWYKFDIYN